MLCLVSCATIKLIRYREFGKDMEYLTGEFIQSMTERSNDILVTAYVDCTCT